MLKALLTLDVVTAVLHACNEKTSWKVLTEPFFKIRALADPRGGAAPPLEGSRGLISYLLSVKKS